MQRALPIVRAPKGLGLTDRWAAQGEWMMFRNFTFNDVEMFGEVMLAAVALVVPVLTLVLFLTN